MRISEKLVVFVTILYVLILVTGCGAIQFPKTSCEESLSDALQEIRHAQSTALSSGSSTLASLNRAEDHIQHAQEVCK